MDPRLYPPKADANASGGAAANADRSIFAIEFVSRDGRRIGLPYALLLMLEYADESGITAEFGHARILIKGTGLQPIYAAILKREVERVEEHAGSATPANDAPFVERIIVERAGAAADDGA